MNYRRLNIYLTNCLKFKKNKFILLFLRSEILLENFFLFLKYLKIVSLDQPNDKESLFKDIHNANVGNLGVKSINRIFKYCIHKTLSSYFSFFYF
jgi:hypothetical protein